QAVRSRAAAEWAAARHCAPRAAPADRGRAAEHAAVALGVPVPAAVPLRYRPVAPGGAVARGDRAGAPRRLLQPRPGRRMGSSALRGPGLIPPTRPVPLLPPPPPH